MLKQNIVFGLLVVSIAACGSSGTSIGTVDNVSLTIKDAISNTYTVQDGNDTFNAATAVLADFTGVCANLAGNNSAPAGNSLVISVFDTNTVVPGDYSFSTALQGAGAKVYLVNAAVGADPATSGSVTLTTIGNDGSMAGSFDATFATGHVAGSFSATACSSVDSAHLGPL